MGIDTQTRIYGPTTTFGGKLVENAVQAIARDLLVAAMFRLEKAGHEVVLHVHDEIVCEVDKGSLPIEKMEDIMCIPPDWGRDLPLAAEGFIARRYRK